MFSKISASIQKITLKTYKKAFETLTLEWSEILGNESNLTDDSLIENELFDKINAWIANLKVWLFDSINSAFDDSLLEEKNLIQKGLFDGFFENVKEIFVKLKDGTETLIRNAILDAQTAAQKISFKIQRVESYEIILSGSPNTCEKCREMAERSKKDPINIAELKFGETAPPFHPNCGCGMIPKVYAKKTGSDWEKIVIAFNVAFEFLAHIGPTEKLFPPFYNFIKSSIWLAGDTYLGIMKKLPLAREMFRLGMYGEGKGMSEKATELIIKAMKNSKKLNDKIFKLTESGEDFDTGDDGFEFKKETDEDLYYAVQNVNMRIIGTNLGENKWKIKVRIWDDYDFTQFRNSLAFADLANNLGEAMQRNSMMTPYNTLTEYEFIWQRK